MFSRCLSEKPWWGSISGILCLTNQSGQEGLFFRLLWKWSGELGMCVCENDVQWMITQGMEKQKAK